MTKNPFKNLVKKESIRESFGFIVRNEREALKNEKSKLNITRNAAIPKRKRYFSFPR